MNILITLCARGGSKGIPGKNIKPLNGKPLIAYSIECAQKFAADYNATITISTDDTEIKRAAEKYGINTPYVRPIHLATDSAGKIETIEDILNYEEQQRALKYDYLLDLDVTSPLRTYDDLKHSFEILRNDTNALNLFSVNLANRNPYFNMVEQKENGYYGLIKTGNFVTRQSAPPVYDMNASFYFYRRAFFEQEHKKSITDRSLIYVMPHLCFDLDHMIDFEFMEYLISTDKLGFSL
jgi:CMP-N,N'-diacetyllegionaminic acid synthase